MSPVGKLGPPAWRWLEYSLSCSLEVPLGRKQDDLDDAVMKPLWDIVIPVDRATTSQIWKDL